MPHEPRNRACSHVSGGGGGFINARPVRDTRPLIPIHHYAQSQGKIDVLLDPDTQMGTDRILADGARNAGAHQPFDNPFKVVQVSGGNQELHEFPSFRFGATAGTGGGTARLLK